MEYGLHDVARQVQSRIGGRCQWDCRAGQRSEAAANLRVPRYATIEQLINLLRVRQSGAQKKEGSDCSAEAATVHICTGVRVAQ